MKKHPAIAGIARGLLSVLLMGQMALAQSPIDAALQKKAKLLSPQLAEQIALQREELRAESEEITTQAIKALDKGEYKKAYHYLTDALQRNPGNLTAKTKLFKVNDILYDVYAGYAKARMNVRDCEAAVKWYREALVHKPRGEIAINGVRKARQRLEESVSKNLGKIISEDMSDNEKVALLIKQARDLEVQSRYEEAKATYKQAIIIEPENPMPRRFLKDLIEKQGRIIADDRRIERRQIMEDLIKAFFYHPEEYIEAAVAGAEEEESPEMKRRAEVIRKANTRLESLAFRDAQIQEVIGFIADVSGLSIVLNLGTEEAETTSIELYNPTALEAIQYICEQQGLTFTIDQYAIVISRGEGEMRTRFWSVSAQAMSSADAVAEEEAEGYDEFDLFADDEAEEDEFETVGAEPEIVRIIKEAVPNWPDGSSVFLESTTGTLIVRQTPGILDEIQSIIEDLSKDMEQLQVEIQARFVQVSDQDLEELSIGMKLRSPFVLDNHRKGSGEVVRGSVLNPTDLTGALRRYSTGRRNSRYADRLRQGFRMIGIREGNNQVTDAVIGFFTNALSQPDVGLVFYAISNQTDSDILSAPKVTTVSGGSRVNIRQITEVLYPDEYTVYKPAIIYYTASGGAMGMFGGIGATLSAVAGTYPGYATVESTLVEDVGIELTVSPTIGENGQTVSMDVTTHVSSEISPHKITVYVGNDNVVPPIEPITISVPRFKTSEVKTQVVVNDGETIVLGGMITESIRRYHDKVPFWGDLPLVGRFFRAEGNYQQKKNLLIFVTTRIITPTGESFKELRERRLREQAEEADAIERPEEEAPAEEEAA